MPNTAVPNSARRTGPRPLAVLVATLSLAFLASCGSTVSGSRQPAGRDGFGNDACTLLPVRTVADGIRVGDLHQVRLPTQDNAGTPLNTCGYVDASNTPQATLSASGYPGGEPAALIQGAVAMGTQQRAAIGVGDAATFADLRRGKLLAAAKRSGGGVHVVIFGTRDGAVPDEVMASIVSGVLGR